MGQVLRDLGGRALRFALCAALVGVAVAHVRLRYSVDGTALYWENPDEITLVIQSDGSDNIGDGSHEIAIRGAMEAWNGASGSRARLSESLASRDRRDWQANDVHLVVFDENNSVPVPISASFDRPLNSFAHVRNKVAVVVLQCTTLDLT